MGKKFKCKSEKQKRAIRISYAIRSKQDVPTVPPVEPKVVVNLPKFKLPLVEGGHRWNIYKVPNFILNGKNDGGVHGGLVIDENNNNVLLVEVTHSPKHGKRNNCLIRNLKSDDLDENGQLKASYFKRGLIVSIQKKGGKEGIDVSALKKQMNDLNFTTEEKNRVLEELSNLGSAESKYKEFIELAKNKKNDD